MYGMVYVYEFEGHVAEKTAAVMDGDFIGSWREAGYSFLFFHKPKGELLKTLSLPFRSELAIRHEDWESGAPLCPVKVGQIGIHQPWNPPPTGEISISIDPNMAFGSGFHSSTRGCLTLLDKLFAFWTPARVLDLGTGTGVLSLACLKMGAKSAIGVDSNGLALRTAVENRRANGLADRLHLVMARAQDMLHVDADLLIANMHFPVINSLVESTDFYGREYYLISGMIRTEGKAVLDKVKERLELLDSFSENYWITYLFKAP